MKEMNMKRNAMSLWPLLMLLLSVAWAEHAFAYYDPGVQRWINRDPAKEAGGQNLSRFVRNDPIGRVDAKGLFPVEISDQTLKFLKDCMCNASVGSSTQTKLLEKGVDIRNNVGGGNAYMHCVAACTASQKCGAGEARQFWTDREQNVPGQPEVEKAMDLANNEVGFGIAGAGNCESGCAEAWRKGNLHCLDTKNQPGPCPSSAVPDYLK